MGDLFWNKIAGVILALFLFIMALGIVVEVVFAESDDHGDGESHYGYPVDLSAMETSGGEEPVEEGPVDFGALLLAADVSAGERVIRRCTSCHTVEPGGGNGTGPALWDVMGRAVAGVDGFNYSAAFQDYAAGGTTWGYENMSAFLENPRQYIDGTAMSFAGIRDQEDRINLIAYLRSLSNNPIALPQPLPEEDSEITEASAETEGEPLTVDEDMSEALVEDLGEEVQTEAEDAVDDAQDAAEEVVEDAEEDLPTITAVDQNDAEDDAEGEPEGEEPEGEEPGR